MNNLNNITTILTDDRKYFRIFNRMDVEEAITMDGFVYTNDLNGLLNKFATDDDFLVVLDEDDQEYILDMFDGEEVRVIAGLLQDGYNWMEAANILEEGIYYISNRWFNDDALNREAYDYLTDTFGYDDIDEDEEIKCELYDEAHEVIFGDEELTDGDWTEDELNDMVGEEYLKLIRIMKNNIGEDFLNYDCNIVVMNQGLIIVKNNI